MRKDPNSARQREQALCRRFPIGGKRTAAVLAALEEFERETNGPVAWSAWEARARPLLPSNKRGGSLRVFLDAVSELEHAGLVARVDYMPGVAGVGVHVRTAKLADLL